MYIVYIFVHNIQLIIDQLYVFTLFAISFKETHLDV